MKKLLFTLMLFPTLVWAQLTTFNPDTVCYQTGGSFYEVPLSPGLVYTWTVTSPGVVVAGQGSSQLQVDWSTASPGLIPAAIQVQAANTAGCTSLTVSLDVFIYNVVLSLDPILDLCEGSACVQLTATPPGGTWSGIGVAAGQFCPNSSGAGSFTVTYEYSDAGCTFASAMLINVLPAPVLLPIQHN